MPRSIIIHIPSTSLQYEKHFAGHKKVEGITTRGADGVVDILLFI
jgi:hypothetical protein